MFISDLNYLEVANEEICGGRRRGGRGYRFRKDIDINVDVKFNVKKDVDSKVDIKGNLADAEAYAEADGYNSLAETFTDSYATWHSSSAYSGSISAVD